MSPPPGLVLTTARLWLRRVTPADADALVALDSDPAVMRYLTGGRATPAATIHEIVIPRWLAQYEQWPGLGSFIAVEQHSGTVIGWFHFRPSAEQPTETELGYRLRQASWGQGYATEGSRALVAYGFDHLDCQRVVAVTLADNTASRRVMEKVGLRLETEFVYDVADRTAWHHGRAAVTYGLSQAAWRQRI